MDITNIIGLITGNFNKVVEVVVWLIAGSSIIVKFAPQLADNHVFKIVLRVLGKIALNRSNPKV